MKKTLLLSLLSLVFMLSACTPPTPDNPDNSDNPDQTEKTDDWVFTGPKNSDDGGIFSRNPQSTMAPMAAVESEAALGFSVGGAKDINNFRENIENGFFPIPTDITYEGLFYDYYFDTGQKQECQKLFCPSYTTAISPDPFSGADDYYLSVGLNSNIKESDFQRKKLNLVIVLDISGSMSSPFDKYYYDNINNGFLEEPAEKEEDFSKSKMEIANEAVVGLLDHLNADDRFGMVVFDDSGYLGKPLSLVGQTDMKSIKDHVLEITPAGGTNMEAGMKMGTELFDEYKNINADEYENRIIFLTDAMPNIATTDDESLQGMFEKNADNGIYTTFIGIGVDFNTELTEALTRVRGANYYSVHSSKEFMTRMDDEFEYMVTPLVFNLELNLEAEGYEILKVYGSPQADEATGQLMKVNTLFPSKTSDGETRGGLVLLKLKKTADNGEIILTASYEDRNGAKDSDQKEIVFEQTTEFYDNTGIQKGILLARYADLILNWLIDEYPETPDTPIQPRTVPLISLEDGLLCPPPFPPYILNEWERQSVELSVSEHYKELFKEFKTHLETEVQTLRDENLYQETEVLDLLTTS